MTKTIQILLSFLFLICPMQTLAEWFQHSFNVMGTEAKVEFEWKATNEAELLINQVVNEMRRIDQLMSPFKKESELTRINNHGAEKPLVISKELFQLIQRSLDFSKLTDGAFDISFSSVGYLYNYRNKLKPSAEQIKSLKDAINYRNIQLDPSTNSIYFSDARVRIDLGGIAKGYAVDRCIDLLKAAGVRNAYVSAGGDSRLIGFKQDRLWYIGIKHPRKKDKFLVNLPLEEVALSTSGDYERFFIEQGIRYHHIIDPKTGESAKTMQSATILADDSTTADALSTSIFVLGAKRGLELINSLPNTSAIIVDAHGKMLFSDDLASVE